jgi:hypothetical protein
MFLGLITTFDFFLILFTFGHLNCQLFFSILFHFNRKVSGVLDLDDGIKGLKCNWRELAAERYFTMEPRMALVAPGDDVGDVRDSRFRGIYNI